MHIWQGLRQGYCDQPPCSAQIKLYPIYRTSDLDGPDRPPIKWLIRDDKLDVWADCQLDIRDDPGESDKETEKKMQIAVSIHVSGTFFWGMYLIG